MDMSELEARLSRLESRVPTNPPMSFGSAVERSMSAFAEKRTAANARALLEEIDKAEPNFDEGVMSGPTITITITITVTTTIKAKEADGTETDPERTLR